MPGARDGQLRINRGTDSPPWTLLIWDDALQDYRDLHGADGATGATGPAGTSLLIWDDDGTALVDSGEPVTIED